ncbi:cyclic nucleotide-binding domain-containing protein [Rhodobacteraceae bacterium]|jgi:CRP-like cAMP-binding protein|nr:cyclic nucleotide-binding domain-containing protein [Paracoccaceae bacterium]
MNISQLQQKFSRKTLDKGETLFNEGEVGGQGFIIEVGEISLYKDNKKTAVLGEGEVVGVWKVLLDQDARFFTAKATIKTILFIIPEDYLDSIVKDADPFLKHCFKQWVRITTG